MTTENTVPAATLAGLFDCDERTIRNLADKGIVTKAGRGRYLVGQSVRDYIRHLRASASGRDGATETLTAARTRLAQAKAQEAETRNRIAAGRLLDADEVLKKWSSSYSTIRSRMMSLPSSIAADLNLTRADAARIDDLVRAALNDAADEIGGDKNTPAPKH